MEVTPTFAFTSTQEKITVPVSDGVIPTPGTPASGTGQELLAGQGENSVQWNIYGSVVHGEEWYLCYTEISKAKCASCVWLYSYSYIYYYSCASCDLYTRTTVPCSTMHTD